MSRLGVPATRRTSTVLVPSRAVFFSDLGPVNQGSRVSHSLPPLSPLCSFSETLKHKTRFQKGQFTCPMCRAKVCSREDGKGKGAG